MLRPLGNTVSFREVSVADFTAQWKNTNHKSSLLAEYTLNTRPHLAATKQLKLQYFSFFSCELFCKMLCKCFALIIYVTIFTGGLVGWRSAIQPGSRGDWRKFLESSTLAVLHWPSLTKHHTLKTMHIEKHCTLKILHIDKQHTEKHYTFKKHYTLKTLHAENHFTLKHAL